MAPSNFNAAIRYRNSGFGLWVMGLNQTHALGGSSAQSKWFKHFYTKSYSPGVMNVTGRVRTQHRYDQLAEFIRAHHEVLLSGESFSNTSEGIQIPLMKLSIPSENLYMDGWIENFQGGAKKFNPAPEFSFDFFIIRDNHSANYEMIPASVIRSWWEGHSIYAGHEIQNQVQVDTAEGIIDNPYSDPNSDKRG